MFRRKPVTSKIDLSEVDLPSRLDRLSKIDPEEGVRKDMHEIRDRTFKVTIGADVYQIGYSDARESFCGETLTIIKMGEGGSMSGHQKVAHLVLGDGRVFKSDESMISLDTGTLREILSSKNIEKIDI